MFATPETLITCARAHALVAAFIGCCLVSHAVWAQTIDEITELQRQKVVAELKRQVREEARKDVDAESLTRPLMINVPQGAPPPQRIQSPDVVAIFGVRADALIAVVSEPEARNVRVRVGDATPGGWTVAKISQSTVTFTRPAPATKAAASKASKNKTKLAAQQPAPEIRVQVAWGRSPQAVAQPAMGMSLPMPVPGAGLPVGMGYPTSGNAKLIVPPMLAPLPTTTGIPPASPTGSVN